VVSGQCVVCSHGGIIVPVLVLVLVHDLTSVHQFSRGRITCTAALWTGTISRQAGPVGKKWGVDSRQFSWERTIVLVPVLVLVLVHDLTFAYTSSWTGNVYRCAMNGYDLPASWISEQ
jgi:hypothetical protein